MSLAKSTRSLNDLLSAAQLPALPQSAIRLLELSQDAKNGPPEFAAPIESDPGLTGQVLRFVNSSYFGFAQEISSIRLAISLVGVRTIKNFALWNAVFSVLPNPKCGPFELKFLWQDSLRRGVFSRAIGRLLRLQDADDLFAAALLQDMAIPLLAKELPSEYQQLLTARANGSQRLSSLEQEMFNWTHAQAAGVLARVWRLPATFAELIESHTSLDKLLAQPDAKMTSLIVALSALLPSSIDADWADRPAFEEGFKRICSTSAQMLKLFRQVDEEFVEFAPVLKLSGPTKSLVEFLKTQSCGAF